MWPVDIAECNHPTPFLHLFPVTKRQLAAGRSLWGDRRTDDTLLFASKETSIPFMSEKTRAALIGVGGMARWHIREILKQQDTTEIAVVCEPSEAAYAESAKLFVEAGLRPPPNEPDLNKLLARGPLDAAFIITPHVFHHDQTVACLEAGLDVLLEKPMVMNGAEAESLIAAQERTGRLLVVAFPGSLSPQIRTAVRMLRSGELGRLLSISATVWQDWGPNTVGTWRQVPALSGGGFLFDTGAHMLNTVVDLAGEEFAEVAAWLDDNGRPWRLSAW